MSEPAEGGRPSHYKVICISLYTSDIDHLDELVAGAKARGMTKASKSWIIRQALRQIDPDKLPSMR